MRRRLPRMRRRLLRMRRRLPRMHCRETIGCAQLDPAEMWAERAEAIDSVKDSWKAIADAAMEGDWESVVEASKEAGEVDV